MKSYAILCHPGHNRVYFEESLRFSVNEMKILGTGMSADVKNISMQAIVGIPYVTFDTANELGEGDLGILGRLSFLYALFEVAGKSLIPVEIPDFRYMDTDISSILKYTGKTNEIFTRMLLNIAVSAYGGLKSRDLKILDPIAGKATTLFEGLICGYNVYGIEIGDKTVNEVYQFFKKYLERGKYKHETKTEKIGGPGKSFAAHRYAFSFAKTKEEYKDKKIKELEIIAGNSIYANAFYKRHSFDIIAGDLPYGVQHGNVTNEKQSSLTRNPKELMEKCLPVWKDVLKKNGVIALAWNTFVLSRKEMTAVLEENGFRICDGEAYGSFEHRVDQAIKRDIIIAIKSDEPNFKASQNRA